MVTSEHSDNITSLINYFRNIHLLFEKALKIDKEVFGFSIRKIIPLPFIFKFIDYGKLCDEGAQILKELYNIEAEITLIKRELVGFDKPIDFLLEYTDLFIETQLILNKICEQMYLKSENKAKVNYADYNVLCEKYKALDSKRYKYGLQMNDIAHTLGFNAPN